MVWLSRLEEGLLVLYLHFLKGSHLLVVALEMQLGLELEQDLLLVLAIKQEL